MGKCSFNSIWLMKDDGTGCKVSEWGQKEDESSIFCLVCTTKVLISSKGFQAITQHADTVKHREQMKLKKNPLQMLIRPVNHNEAQESGSESKTSALYLFSQKDSATAAELIWTLKTVACNYSAASCLGIVDTFKAMFPNSIPDGFTLNPKKIHYLITDALAPYLMKEIINDMKNSFYTIMYDETTNASNKKELQIIVRYWSEVQNRVRSSHLKTMFIGSATAETIFKNLTDTMDEMKLPRSRLLMLGSDGPYVNKKVHRLMNEEMMLVCERKLVDIGTCNVHIVHNAYLKGISELGENAADLITALYYFFDGWPSRWEEYTKIQLKEGVSSTKFLKHCSSRWLTLEPACKRVIEQWPAVITYFLKYIPQSKSSLNTTNRHVNNITSLLRSKTLKAELHFVASSASIFTSFTGLFQREEPLVHVMHEELHALIRTLVGRFCKASILKQNVFDSETISDENNHLPMKQIVCCENAKKEIESASDSERYNFLKAAKKHYLAACKHLVDKTSFSSDVLQKLRCLHPKERKTARSCNDVVAVAKVLQIDIAYDKLIDEWKAIQQEDDFPQENPIDIYWGNFLSLKTSLGELKYPLVSAVVKAALVLSHGNAEVERGFSASGRALTEDKASMSERTLSSIMTIKSVLKNFNNKPELVPITKELLSYARAAYRSYENYLTEQKKLKEVEEERKRDEEEKKCKDQENKEKALKDKKDIKNCQEILKEKREKEKMKRKTADSLFEEATKRLKLGVENKNFQEIQIAQAMLQGVATVRKEEDAEREKGDKIQKTLEKKKSTLIESYFKKK